METQETRWQSLSRSYVYASDRWTLDVWQVAGAGWRWNAWNKALCVYAGTGFAPTMEEAQLDAEEFARLADKPRLDKAPKE